MSLAIIIRAMRTVFGLVAAGVAVFAGGLAMLLANWHDLIGLVLMVIGIGYLVWELVDSMSAVPGPLKLCFGVIILSAVLGFGKPSVEHQLQLNRESEK